MLSKKVLNKKMLHKSFDPVQCKTSLKLSVSRIKVLRNKRELLLKSLKGELAKLLQAGEDQTAMIRVEHLSREEKMKAAYDLVEIYCEQVAANLLVIDSQKSCPLALKEAIASVIFASPRCPELPELKEVQKQLTRKYGKDFVSIILELRPGCGVGALLIEKMSTRAPDGPTKVKLLSTIAKEHNIEWVQKEYEQKLDEIPIESLSGPSTFEDASRSFSKPPPQHSRQQNIDLKPTNVENFSEESVASSKSTGLHSIPSTNSSKGTGGSVTLEQKSGPCNSVEKQSWSTDLGGAEAAPQASMTAKEAIEFVNSVREQKIENEKKGSETKMPMSDSEEEEVDVDEARLNPQKSSTIESSASPSKSFSVPSNLPKDNELEKCNKNFGDALSGSERNNEAGNARSKRGSIHPSLSSRCESISDSSNSQAVRVKGDCNAMGNLGLENEYENPFGNDWQQGFMGRGEEYTVRNASSHSADKHSSPGSLHGENSKKGSSLDEQDIFTDSIFARPQNTVSGYSLYKENDIKFDVEDDTISSDPFADRNAFGIRTKDSPVNKVGLELPFTASKVSLLFSESTSEEAFRSCGDLPTHFDEAEGPKFDEGVATNDDEESLSRLSSVNSDAIRSSEESDDQTIPKKSASSRIRGHGVDRNDPMESTSDNKNGLDSRPEAGPRLEMRLHGGLRNITSRHSNHRGRLERSSSSKEKTSKKHYDIMESSSSDDDSRDDDCKDTSDYVSRERPVVSTVDGDPTDTSDSGDECSYEYPKPPLSARPGRGIVPDKLRASETQMSRRSKAAVVTAGKNPDSASKFDSGLASMMDHDWRKPSPMKHQSHMPQKSGNRSQFNQRSHESGAEKPEVQENKVSSVFKVGQAPPPESRASFSMQSKSDSVSSSRIDDGLTKPSAIKYNSQATQNSENRSQFSRGPLDVESEKPRVQENKASSFTKVLPSSPELRSSLSKQSTFEPDLRKLSKVQAPDDRSQSKQKQHDQGTEKPKTEEKTFFAVTKVRPDSSYEPTMASFRSQNSKQVVSDKTTATARSPEAKKGSSREEIVNSSDKKSMAGEQSSKSAVDPQNKVSIPKDVPSKEDSSNRASHVHPKLPNYDDIASFLEPHRQRRNTPHN